MPAHPDPVIERVRSLFEEHLGLEVPSEDEPLFGVGGLDSLSLVDLLAHLEEAFGITVTLDDLELENFESLRRIADFVHRRRDATDAVPAGPEGEVTT